MWCFLVLALSEHWEERAEIRWLKGEGSKYCKKGRHVTVACVTIWRPNGDVKTYCSDATYVDESRVHVISCTERPCVPTREPIGKCGQGPTFPRCHSEIAALQDLFDIPEEQNVKEWADKIKRQFSATESARRLFDGELKGIYVSLYNSGLHPCTDPAREGYERVPCNTMLREVANKVNVMLQSEAGKGERFFGIRVQYPVTNKEGKEIVRVVNYGTGAGTRITVNRLSAISHSVKKRHRKHKAANSGQMDNVNVNFAVLFAFMLGF